MRCLCAIFAFGSRCVDRAACILQACIGGALILATAGGCRTLFLLGNQCFQCGTQVVKHLLL
jgi:hypothetical protein